MYCVYILENLKENLYIGQTNDLDDRVIRHNTNRVKSTKNKGPWKLIYKKYFPNRSLAMEHERYLKSIKNKKYIKNKFLNSPGE